MHISCQQCDGVHSLNSNKTCHLATQRFLVARIGAFRDFAVLRPPLDTLPAVLYESLSSLPTATVSRLTANVTAARAMYMPEEEKLG